MVIKLIGLGIKSYFTDKYNVLDFVVVLVTCLDFIYIINKDLFQNYTTNFKVLKSLRAFRVLRMFKLARLWPQLYNMIKLVGYATKEMSNFCILLFLFLFTFSIIGMDNFAYKAKFNENWKYDSNGTYINENFNTFIEAFTTVFVVLTGDNWCDIFYKHYRGVSSYTSALFFLLLKIIGEYILLLLLLAILIEYLDEDSLNSESKKKTSGS